MQKHKYKMPRGMRYSKLVDRAEFYCREFSEEALKDWEGFQPNTVIAFLLGKYTNVYLSKFADIKDDVVVIDDYCNFVGLREYLLKYLPEGVYYDTHRYDNLEICHGCPERYKTQKCHDCEHYIGQELVFDLDPENVYCPVHGDLDRKLKMHQGRMLCMIEFNILRRKAVLMYNELRQMYSKLCVVYSGRGFHIHVLDEDTLHLPREERQDLAHDFANRYPIDEWVTAGNIKLIRLPYTLHGMISRICIPLKSNEIETFNPVSCKATIPRYLEFEGSQQA
ncbi:MAG: DNA primase [Halobacteriota archaeon]